MSKLNKRQPKTSKFRNGLLWTYCPDFINIIGDNHLTWAFDQAGRFSRSYQSRALHTTIISDEENREIYRATYPTRYDLLRDKLRKVL